MFEAGGDLVSRCCVGMFPQFEVERAWTLCVGGQDVGFPVLPFHLAVSCLDEIVPRFVEMSALGLGLQAEQAGSAVHEAI